MDVVLFLARTMCCNPFCNDDVKELFDGSAPYNISLRLPSLAMYYVRSCFMKDRCCSHNYRTRKTKHVTRSNCWYSTLPSPVEALLLFHST